MQLKVKINLEKIVFELNIIMIMLYTLFYCISPSAANKIVIFDLILTLIYLIRYMARVGKTNKFIVFNGLVLFYILYTAVYVYPEYLFNSYFYAYLFLFVQFELFSNKEVRQRFYKYFENAWKRFILYIIIYLMLILFSFFKGEALRQDSGIRVLYGPYEIPHYFAYIILGVYCGISEFEKKLSRKLILCLKLICCIIIICTAVRSAALALGVLVVYDYISIRGIQKKGILIICGLLGFLYILFGTDLLVNNAIVEKTIYAIKYGGSITNNRDWFRKAAFEYYFHDINILQQLVGASMPNLISAINRSVGFAIHAHNDYANILVGYGMIAFVGLLYYQKKYLNISQCWSAKIFFQLYLFTLCFFNGFGLYTMLLSVFPINLYFFEKQKNLSREK